MEDNPTQEIPAYVRHRYGWHVRTRVAVVMLICVGSMIIYWFVSSSMENRRDGRHRGSAGGKSRKMAHLERLSDQVLPLEYTLKILPILEEKNFTMIGDAQIEFYSKVPTKHIRLHARKLLLQDVSVREYRSPNASKIKSTYVVMDEDFIDVFLLHVLIAKEIYILHIKYMIPLHEQPKGFFRSAHIDRDTNETRWIAVSNFSPNYARTAYPCFDEPWIKTPFRISIGRKSNMRSHSNSMRKFTEEIHGMSGYVWDHYEKTFRMPTYVVAFMVTDFSSYDVAVTDRPSHTIFFRKEIENDTRYIGDLIPKVLRAVQNLTGFYYELDKLDVIVVPEYAYTAMENWGLITFREDVILVKKDDTESERGLDKVVAHEVAHQWFGNLVTPKWWDEVWLKEGFSSFFGFLALKTLEPASWNLQTHFLNECHDVFDSDADEAAHPLHIDLRKLSGLTGIFDSTSYVKGNCMAHMIYHFLGERLFLSCVRHYMRMYHYRNADQEDLWSAFQMEIDGANGLPASSGLRMKDVMRTWTYQAGFPVLRVQQNRETGAIELTQDRFYRYGLNSTSEELWHIPLTWTTENEQQFSNTLPKAWMVKKRMKINDIALSRATSNNQWILFNINQTALYRVNYDVENWKLLTKSFRALPQATKAQVLTDSFAMANAEQLDKRIMWNIFEKMETENGEMLWKLALRLLNTIQDQFWDSSLFKFVMCKFIDKVYSKMAPAIYKDPTLWTDFEISLMKFACSVDYQACLTAVLNFDQEMLRNESNSLPQGFRRWVYCTLVKVATKEEWLALLKRYNESAVHDKRSLTFALGCQADASLLQRYLAIIYSQKNITSEYATIALESVALNPYGYHIAIEFIRQHWNKFNTNTTEENTNYVNVTLIGVLDALSSHIHQKEDMELVLQLKGKSEKYDTMIGKVINRVQTNAWYRRQKNEG
ncbi:thyrotropin-releasing hormone-degrading ectoenzyme isoform X2 [Monomorium pharaonis]|uniref:thyrotropin-releasing hormone-degrading ectoenzyme isoform X2 n=1 Tax=Monomorium pharaonis TaxID=307658 RepID=UPI00102E1CE9|nr:thyrotropin-releasing hormone-degrading ectoenzyme isoform X2 [Monomorium pharaonis]